MKNLIIYSSMFGCTRKCATTLKDKLQGDSLLLDANQDRLPDPADFDNVVLGSSIKIGKIGKKLSRYVKRHHSTLAKKKLGLFICSGDQEADYFGKNFPADLIAHAVAKEYLGGEISMDKVDGFTRYILKLAKKAQSYLRLQPEKLDQLAAAVNG